MGPPYYSAAPAARRLGGSAIRGHGRADRALIVGFGAVLAGMNSLFHQAIERIPLGAAVTLQVLGPPTLSVITAWRAASWL